MLLFKYIFQQYLTKLENNAIIELKDMELSNHLLIAYNCSFEKKPNCEYEFGDLSYLLFLFAQTQFTYQYMQKLREKTLFKCFTILISLGYIITWGSIIVFKNSNIFEIVEILSKYLYKIIIIM